MIHFIGVRRNHVYALLLVLTLFGVSCSEDNSPIEPTKDEDLKGVFISGTAKSQQGVPAATYWNNGTPVNLVVTSPIYSSTGIGMTVSGSDIYVCGVMFGGPNVPVYWKNGEATILTGYGQANEIA